MHQVVRPAVRLEQVRYPLMLDTSGSIPTNDRMHAHILDATDGLCRAARFASTSMFTRAHVLILARLVREPLATRVRCHGIGAPIRACVHTNASLQGVTKSFVVAQPCDSTSSATTAKPHRRGHAARAHRLIPPGCHKRRQCSTVRLCLTMRRSSWRTTWYSPRVVKLRHLARPCTLISPSAASGPSPHRSL